MCALDINSAVPRRVLLEAVMCTWWPRAKSLDGASTVRAVIGLRRIRWARNCRFLASGYLAFVKVSDSARTIFWLDKQNRIFFRARRRYLRPRLWGMKKVWEGREGKVASSRNKKQKKGKGLCPHPPLPNSFSFSETGSDKPLSFDSDIKVLQNYVN